MDIQYLVKQANKLGAKGYRVLGWEPPKSATDNPNGRLIYIFSETQKSATEIPWYDDKK